MTAGPSRLLQLVTEVTYRCPSKCVFCYNAWHDRYDEAPELTVGQYSELARKLPPANCIIVSGGEPLVRKDVFEVIEALSPVSRSCSFLTSGQLMDRKTAGKLARPGFRVQIPLHGLERTHDRLTGMKGGFRKAIDSIAMLAEAGAVYNNNIVVNRENFGELEQVLEMSVALGSDQLFVIRFLPGGRGLSHREMMLDRKQTEKMLEVVDSVAGRYGIKASLGVPNVPCVIDEGRFRHISFHGCSAGVDWFAMDPSGRLRVCNHSPTILGDLRKQTFTEIMANPLLEKLRRNELLPPKCLSCRKNKECRGGCRAVAETMYGDWCAPDPLME